MPSNPPTGALSAAREAVLRKYVAKNPNMFDDDRDLLSALDALRAENGRMKSAITESLALFADGTEYEGLHIGGILRAAIDPEKKP